MALARRIGLASGMLAIPALPALADTTCDALHHIETTTRAQSTDTSFPPGFGTCTWVKVVGGASEAHCRWPFEYRDAAATDWFHTLSSAVETCFPGLTPEPQEPGVNHPDAYVLKEYDATGQTIFVTQKDKANLSKTFVFLRIGRTSP